MIYKNAYIKLIIYTHNMKIPNAQTILVLGKLDLRENRHYFLAC